jgi:hypothetical protein
VRIIPYRTQANLIDGLVLTLVDITELKGMETTMRKALGVLQGRFDKQTTELTEATALEGVLRTTQSVLEERLTGQAASSRNSVKLEADGEATK